MKLARLHHAAAPEPIWHVQAAVLAAIILQLALSSSLSAVPKYMLASVEMLLLLVLMVSPRDGRMLWRVKRSAALLLIVIISVANIMSLILVVHSLLTGSTHDGRALIASGFAIYLTNIIVFGLWYWEMDSNGVQGQSPAVRPIDFLFPQMTPGEHVTKPGMWSPTFFDYLYVSITNATAFSPTDSFPLTHRAKALMSIQALVSVSTIALVAARAVGILN
ncbi:MAG: hypothetical protein KIH63_003945 [Candidatus Saccharibacteria bacterium]|nr:hypothetical protein [Candidatus Saccharibacteria bacterium]